MSFSTFSGPIRSGTQRYNPGRNTGLAVLTQSATIDMAGVALTSAAPVQDLFTLPAGSKILSFRFEKTVILAGNSISQVAAIVGNASTRAAMLADPSISAVVSVWEAITVCLVGIGSVEP